MPNNPLLRTVLLIGVSVFLSCASNSLEHRYGPSTPREISTAAARAGQPVDYENDIRAIMEKRCLICHGCYDAPCQLKLESYEGIIRGGSEQLVYDGKRLTSVQPTRLYTDARSTQEWRQMGFTPVINERVQTPQANLEAGLMSRMLQLKQKHPLPAQEILPDSFDFSLKRDQVCPSAETFDDFADDHPLWGMPYGLPRLPREEYDTLLRWLENGAPQGQPRQPAAHLSRQVRHWEQFFNGSSLKQQLVSRYLYEHLYLSHLYFEDAGHDTTWFRLVRSSTPPGQPVMPVATRRPFDDPGVERVYYRLWATPSSVVDKTHMPYRLDPAREQRWQQWFMNDAYTVTGLPGYTPEIAANPFRAFQQIPRNARYRFLLDEAQHTIMNFIKGSVCRGALALNVIRDRFWVFFINPELEANGVSSDFLAQQRDDLRLPSETGTGSILDISHWRKYEQAEARYLEAKGQFIRQKHEQLRQLGLELIWQGDGSNPNAALTVFRHYDSASVVQGLAGSTPLTAWVIDYPILERIHYLLVAGYDVFGSIAHQTMTRLYMDFLRMESEMNFLAFLPLPARQATLARWYQDASSDSFHYIRQYFEHNSLPSLVNYRSTRPREELLHRLQQRIESYTGKPAFDLSRSGLPESALNALSGLDSLRGQPATTLPQTTLINITDGGVLTLLSNIAYTNLSTMFDEEDRRLPEQDSLTLVNGVLGAFPNAILEVDTAGIQSLANRLKTIRNEQDYRRLLGDYGVRRSNPGFWSAVDSIQEKYRKAQPLTAGIIDYNRFENR